MVGPEPIESPHFMPTSKCAKHNMHHGFQQTFTLFDAAPTILPQLNQTATIITSPITLAMAATSIAAARSLNVLTNDIYI